MNINITKEDSKTIIALAGRLDTTTTPELEEKMSDVFEGCKSLVFDFKELEYISSAGLRVLLSSQKKMNSQGDMKLINVGPEIYEVFQITGFVDILTIEG